MNTPNKITQADFDGWVQERGMYFPDQWDEHFTPILASGDPGEKPLQGGLLVAQHGKGYFVYTGLVFFRQLPEGVPGAYRLFANLVSLGQMTRSTASRPAARMSEPPGVPGFRTWRGVYLFVIRVVRSRRRAARGLLPDLLMNVLDWVVLLGTMLGIAGYGVWRTRQVRSLNTYLKGSRSTGWGTIGLSVMATQASAITFLSIPGQGFESGIGFVQNYFGLPLALVIVCAVFLPIYRRLDVYTAYEFLGRRFDAKTRLLGAGLFLLQRGLAAGVTIYAPAIILSTVLGWRLDLVIVGSGLLVIVYTVTGGSEAVSLTQKYQMAVIFGGMVAAFVVLLRKLPAGSASRVPPTLPAPSASCTRSTFRWIRTGATRSGPACSAGCFSRSPTSAPTSRRCSATSAAPRCARAGSA